MHQHWMKTNQFNSSVQLTVSNESAQMTVAVAEHVALHAHMYHMLLHQYSHQVMLQMHAVGTAPKMMTVVEFSPLPVDM